MSDTHSVAAHWDRGDLFEKILSALRNAGLEPDRVTVEDLALADHFHARGFTATVELADQLPIRSGQRILDIGCGVGGPARYMAKRFGCIVNGVDITPSFVEAANQLTTLLHMESEVVVERGDGQQLPFGDAAFDGAYAQHVTMNVSNRPTFFAEAFRVLKPGGFFALTEHGLGPRGGLHYPVPWSMDGGGEYLATPTATRTMLEEAGFTEIAVEETGAKYLVAYESIIEKAETGGLPPLGIHVLMGETWLQRTRNSARNIAEERTHPIQVICRKP